jgi:hypothetical protein
VSASYQRLFGDPEPVASRPCRGCGTPCEVTATGMAALKSFNKILLDRGEMPLNETKIFACERCELKVRDVAGQSNRDKVEEMRAIILDLREAVDPPSEKAMIARLEELGHPDVTGLLHAIGERRAAEKTVKGRGR